MQIGLDVGSTTVKAVVLNAEKEIVFSRYQRHFSQIVEKTHALLTEISALLPEGEPVSLAISGSAGMGLADACEIPFVQEVYATRLAVSRLLPGTDAVIELGGEDAKILFLTGMNGAPELEVRMNGTCAGGTGAFIDQMATLLNVSADEMNALAEKHEKLYSVASRCGVFAKSDIQPLLNQGARREDVAASIFAAVVNQTIAGLAQGREIEGNVVYLGGPLTFLPELRKLFDSTLRLTGTCPENSLYYVAYGAALNAKEKIDLPAALKRIDNYSAKDGYISCAPLFKSEQDYAEFAARHARDRIETVERPGYQGKVYIGVDAGSTTVKAVAVSEDDEILYSEYMPSGGTPVPRVREFLQTFYQKYPDATVAGACSTGYGEDMIRAAFRLDTGVVETMAHFTAAKKFRPEVDFIIDIGGQDIKCFKIVDGAIDDIFLNEACSSGCGSFLQTFAGAWGDTIQEFAARGLKADRPVDLGSRCTVFMNSSVKQAQKDGASLENISAGLSISVVKNALYKVVRTANAKQLGEHIVVQGGTFLNDAVLRAFELEIGRDVVRPNIAGLMGAYGAALWAQAHAPEKSSILTPQELEAFTHEVRSTTCNGCTNHCTLTVNRFDGNRSFLSGNRCEKPTGAARKEAAADLYREKLAMLDAYRKLPPPENARARVGLPMALNMYELLPFWHTLLTDLGFEVVVSPESTRELYLAGQQTIPSDTVCYPAKLVHGHIDWLLRQNVDAIFYPCMSYNLDEQRGDNHFNCPVVAYYPELIRANVKALKRVAFIDDYLGLHRPKDFAKKLAAVLDREFGGISRREVKAAVEHAFSVYGEYMQTVRDAGRAQLKKALDEGRQVIVLAGRPYHVDPEINHGIDKLIADLGAVVVTEDAVCDLTGKTHVDVLNQWTYHARMYAAAQYVAECGRPNVNLVQLVSFGCGLDAITTDEVRSILKRKNKIYTQIKIDEITNLGAVKIRLRSLFSAIEGGNGQNG